VVDGDGAQVPARVSVLAADGRAYAPDDAWVHADDNFDRKVSAFETMYFHSPGEVRVVLPTGAASVTVWHGFEHQIEKRSVPISAGATRDLAVKLQPLALPPGWSGRWVSGDVHVHMNYTGTYRNTPERLVGQAAAEDLDVVFNLVVNKEQRIPDIAYFSVKPDAASTAAVLLSHGQEYHTSYWGHLGLLGLRDHFLLPDFSAYSGTAMASLYPTNATVADLAHEQGALVGHVHPYDVVPDPDKDAVLTDSLPVEAALGKLDYYEVLGFSDARASAAVWYRLLNCGFRAVAAGGTDAMANYASLRGPVGLARVYARRPDGSARPADPAARVQEWLASFKSGHTMVTNGPLLDFSVDDRGPGESIELGAAGKELHYHGFLRSAVPIDHLDLVQNGAVIRSIPLNGDRRAADFEGTVMADGTGWLLLRASNDDSTPEILDAYAYATTNPVFLNKAGAAVHCGADADYFLKWIDRLDAAAAAHQDYNTDEEREKTLAEIRSARAVVERRR
jgi:TolB protein